MLDRFLSFLGSLFFFLYRARILARQVLSISRVWKEPCSKGLPVHDLPSVQTSYSGQLENSREEIGNWESLIAAFSAYSKV